MYLAEYLGRQVRDLLGGDVARFDELWDLIPDFSAVLRGFDQNSEWLHWRKKTYDGWYCVRHPDQSFEVYYQERGGKEPGAVFSGEREAIRYALQASGMTIT